MSEGLRIRLDRTVCDGFGVCAKHAPEYFSLDDWGYASLVGDGTVPEKDRDAVMRALMDCPVHAIIYMGEHRPSDSPSPPISAEKTAEPDVKSEDNEAIWGFVR
jgi:ferredoxin